MHFRINIKPNLHISHSKSILNGYCSENIVENYHKSYEIFVIATLGAGIFNVNYRFIS